MPKDKKIVILLAGAAFIFGSFWATLTEKRSVIVKREEGITFTLKADLSEVEREEDVYTSYEKEKNNKISGTRCSAFNRRPFAVMIAEDEAARPLSGIGVADLVIEMPVVTGSITRMMAFFICEDPREIGSVRSARHDFIPLAEGYGAIFVHWGGSSFALDELKNGMVDNLDALPNYFDAFYRKNWIPAPHNGFTSMRRMVYAAHSLGYGESSHFAGYTFTYEPPVRGRGEAILKIRIDYTYPYNLEYEYNPSTNSYYRWRGGREEIDKLSRLQVSAKNVVIMRAESRETGVADYNDVDILGSGGAVIYRNGEEVKGSWEKKKAGDALRFYDNSKKEIEFVPGAIWIEVVEQSTRVTYTL